MRLNLDQTASLSNGVTRRHSNAHDTDTMASPVFSSVYANIVEANPIDVDDLIDNISTGKTLPGAGPVGAAAASPVTQFNRKHEVMAAMAVHYHLERLKV